MKEIGKVKHYFDKIGVAIIELSSGLKVGDTVTIGGKEEFDQEISSIQIDHESVESAKTGEVVGVKVDKVVHEGAKVSLK